MIRSVGARELLRRGQTQEAIAKRVKVSRVAVAHWLSGETKPSAAKRILIAEAYGIPPEAWDQKATTKPKSKDAAAPASPPAPIPEGVLGKARQLEQMAHDLMSKLQAELANPEGPSTHLEVAKVMNSVASTLNLLAKITGQFELGSRLFKLPVWKRIEGALARGLEGHPKAAAAVAAELRRVETEEMHA